MWTVEGGRPTNLFSADGEKWGDGWAVVGWSGVWCCGVCRVWFDGSMGLCVGARVYNGVQVQVGGFVQELSRLILELF